MKILGYPVLVFLPVLAVIFARTYAQLADTMVCADDSCSETISQGEARLAYRPRDDNFLNLKKGDVVLVKSKNAGKKTHLWGGEVMGSDRFGFFPSAFIKEVMVLVKKPDHTVSVQEFLRKRRSPIPEDPYNDLVSPDKVVTDGEKQEGDAEKHQASAAESPTEEDQPPVASSDQQDDSGKGLQGDSGQPADDRVTQTGRSEKQAIQASMPKSDSKDGRPGEEEKNDSGMLEKLSTAGQDEEGSLARDGDFQPNEKPSDAESGGRQMEHSSSTDSESEEPADTKFSENSHSPAGKREVKTNDTTHHPEKVKENSVEKEKESSQVEDTDAPDGGNENADNSIENIPADIAALLASENGKKSESNQHIDAAQKTESNSQEDKDHQYDSSQEKHQELKDKVEDGEKPKKNVGEADNEHELNKVVENQHYPSQQETHELEDEKMLAESVDKADNELAVNSSAQEGHQSHEQETPGLKNEEEKGDMLSEETMPKTGDESDESGSNNDHHAHQDIAKDDDDDEPDSVRSGSSTEDATVENHVEKDHDQVAIGDEDKEKVVKSSLQDVHAQEASQVTGQNSQEEKDAEADETADQGKVPTPPEPLEKLGGNGGENDHEEKKTTKNDNGGSDDLEKEGLQKNRRQGGDELEEQPPEDGGEGGREKEPPHNDKEVGDNLEGEEEERPLKHEAEGEGDLGEEPSKNEEEGGNNPEEEDSKMGREDGDEIEQQPLKHEREGGGDLEEEKPQNEKESGDHLEEEPQSEKESGDDLKDEESQKHGGGDLEEEKPQNEKESGDHLEEQPLSDKESGDDLKDEEDQKHKKEDNEVDTDGEPMTKHKQVIVGQTDSQIKDSQVNEKPLTEEEVTGSELKAQKQNDEKAGAIVVEEQQKSSADQELGDDKRVATSDESVPPHKKAGDSSTPVQPLSDAETITKEDDLKGGTELEEVHLEDSHMTVTEKSDHVADTENVAGGPINETGKNDENKEIAKEKYDKEENHRKEHQHETQEVLGKTESQQVDAGKITDHDARDVGGDGGMPSHPDAVQQRVDGQDVTDSSKKADGTLPKDHPETSIEDVQGLHDGGGITNFLDGDPLLQYFNARLDGIPLTSAVVVQTSDVQVGEEADIGISEMQGHEGEEAEASEIMDSLDSAKQMKVRKQFKLSRLQSDPLLRWFTRHPQSFDPTDEQVLTDVDSGGTVENDNDDDGSVVAKHETETLEPYWDEKDLYTNLLDDPLLRWFFPNTCDRFEGVGIDGPNPADIDSEISTRDKGVSEEASQSNTEKKSHAITDLLRNPLLKWFVRPPRCRVLKMKHSDLATGEEEAPLSSDVITQRSSKEYIVPESYCKDLLQDPLLRWFHPSSLPGISVNVAENGPVVVEASYDTPVQSYRRAGKPYYSSYMEDPLLKWILMRNMKCPAQKATELFSASVNPSAEQFNGEADPEITKESPLAYTAENYGKSSYLDHPRLKWILLSKLRCKRDITTVDEGGLVEEEYDSDEVMDVSGSKDEYSSPAAGGDEENLHLSKGDEVSHDFDDNPLDNDDATGILGEEEEDEQTASKGHGAPDDVPDAAKITAETQGKEESTHAKAVQVSSQEDSYEEEEEGEEVYQEEKEPEKDEILGASENVTAFSGEIHGSSDKDVHDPDQQTSSDIGYVGTNREPASQDTRSLPSDATENAVVLSDTETNVWLTLKNLINLFRESYEEVTSFRVGLTEIIHDMRLLKRKRPDLIPEFTRSGKALRQKTTDLEDSVLDYIQSLTQKLYDTGMSNENKLDIEKNFIPEYRRLLEEVEEEVQFLRTDINILHEDINEEAHNKPEEIEEVAQVEEKEIDTAKNEIQELQEKLSELDEKLSQKDSESGVMVARMSEEATSFKSRIKQLEELIVKRDEDEKLHSEHSREKEKQLTEKLEALESALNKKREEETRSSAEVMELNKRLEEMESSIKISVEADKPFLDRIAALEGELEQRRRKEADITKQEQINAARMQLKVQTLERQLRKQQILGNTKLLDEARELQRKVKSLEDDLASRAEAEKVHSAREDSESELKNRLTLLEEEFSKQQDTRKESANEKADDLELRIWEMEKKLKQQIDAAISTKSNAVPDAMKNTTLVVTKSGTRRKPRSKMSKKQIVDIINSLFLQPEKSEKKDVSSTQLYRNQTKNFESEMSETSAENSDSDFAFMLQMNNAKTDGSANEQLKDGDADAYHALHEGKIVNWDETLDEELENPKSPGWDEVLGGEEEAAPAERKVQDDLSKDTKHQEDVGGEATHHEEKEEEKVEPRHDENKEEMVEPEQPHEDPDMKLEEDVFLTPSPHETVAPKATVNTSEDKDMPDASEVSKATVPEVRNDITEDQMPGAEKLPVKDTVNKDGAIEPSHTSTQQLGKQGADVVETTEDSGSGNHTGLSDGGVLFQYDPESELHVESFWLRLLIVLYNFPFDILYILEPFFLVWISLLPEEYQKDVYGIPWSVVLSTFFVGFFIIWLFICRSRSSKRRFKDEQSVKMIQELRAQLDQIIQEKLEKENELKTKQIELDLQRDEITNVTQEKFDVVTERTTLQHSLREYSIQNDSFKRDIQLLNQQLQEKDNEMHEVLTNSDQVRKSLTAQQETLSQYKDRIEQLQGTITENANSKRRMEDSIEKYKERIKSLEIAKGETKKEGKTWKDQAEKLTKRIAELEESLNAEKEGAELKRQEVDVLKDCILQFKGVQEYLSDEGEDAESEESIEKQKEKMRSMVEVSMVRNQLRQAEAEKLQISYELEAERKEKLETDGKVSELEATIQSDQAVKNKLEKDKQTLESKLTVMQEFYAKREVEIQSKLGMEQSRRESNATLLEDQQKQQLELINQLDAYKKMSEDAKKQYEDTERQHKQEILGFEKKSHENWLASREAERKLDEANKQINQLHVELTDLQRRLRESQDREPILRPRPERHGPPGAPPPFGPPRRGIPPPGVPGSPLHFRNGPPSDVDRRSPPPMRRAPSPGNSINEEKLGRPDRPPSRPDRPPSTHSLPPMDRRPPSGPQMGPGPYPGPPPGRFGPYREGMPPGARPPPARGFGPRPMPGARLGAPMTSSPYMDPSPIPPTHSPGPHSQNFTQSSLHAPPPQMSGDSLRNEGLQPSPIGPNPVEPPPHGTPSGRSSGPGNPFRRAR